MACDRCGPSRESGYSFCPGCGASLSEGCLYCNQYEREGYEFCGKCGRRLEGTPSAPARTDPLKMAAIVSMPFVLILLVVELAVMLWGAADVWTFLADKTTYLFILTPSVQEFAALDGLALQTYWILLMLAIIASAVLVIVQSRDMLRPDSGGDTSKAERTPLYWLCLTFGSMIILNIIVSVIQGMFGNILEVPEWILEMSREEMLFQMAEAAVWEEVASRILPIGVPLTILAACYGRRDALRHLVGGTGVTRVSLALIMISSLAFGFAHVDSWSYAKMVPAAIGGVIMGYLYVRFGVHVSILFHFLTDYMTCSSYLIGEVAFGSIVLLIMITGLVCMVGLLSRTFNGLSGIADMPVTGMDQDSRDSRDD